MKAVKKGDKMVLEEKSRTRRRGSAASLHSSLSSPCSSSPDPSSISSSPLSPNDGSLPPAQLSLAPSFSVFPDPEETKEGNPSKKHKKATKESYETHPPTPQPTTLVARRAASSLPRCYGNHDCNEGANGDDVSGAPPLQVDGAIATLMEEVRRLSEAISLLREEQNLLVTQITRSLQQEKEQLQVMAQLQEEPATTPIRDTQQQLPMQYATHAHNLHSQQQPPPPPPPFRSNRGAAHRDASPMPDFIPHPPASVSCALPRPSSQGFTPFSYQLRHPFRGEEGMTSPMIPGVDSTQHQVTGEDNVSPNPLQQRPVESLHQFGPRLKTTQSPPGLSAMDILTAGADNLTFDPFLPPLPLTTEADCWEHACLLMSPPHITQ